MKTLYGGATALILVPAVAQAVGLDRSNQPVDILFEDGNYLEISVGRIFPSVSGEDLSFAPALSDFAGVDSGGVADDFTQFGAAVKYQLTDRISIALIADEPYGADIDYPGDGGALDLAATPPVVDLSVGEGSNAFGGTRAEVDSQSVTALARYAFDTGFSVHGGLRYTAFDVQVALSGAAFGGLSGYTAEIDEDWELGYIVGAAYERPDLALRVALTYFSKTEHDLDTTERLNGVGVGDLPIPGNPFFTDTTTSIDTPEAINLDLQTGINASTLLFAKIRYAWWGDVTVSPVFYDAQDQPETAETSLTELEDGASYEIGLGRQLSDRLAGSVTLGYEDNRYDLVSPLAPTNGQTSFGLGLSYDATERFTVAGGVRYVSLGDARPETGTPDVARADFEDNDVIGVGMQFGYRF